MKNNFPEPIEQYIDENRMFSKPDIQKLLNVSRSTLARWVKSRKFPEPFIIQNNRSLWRFKDVHRWYERNLKQ